MRIREKRSIALFLLLGSPCLYESFIPRPVPRAFRDLCRLYAVQPDLNSDDPFVVLGLDPTADPKVIKRAYKRMALKYHPDVSKNDKKRASAQFAKINWAYEQIGKNKGGKSAGSSSSSSSSSNNSNAGASNSSWEPPHRRTSAYESPSSSSSSDWRDYMPKYDEADYDSGGDSFGQIFSDLFTGAAASYGVSGASGSSKVGGLFQDLIEFLEGGVGSSSGGGGGGGYYADVDLQSLLATGTIEEVAEEMDDTDLVVQQLVQKVKKVDEELMDRRADLARAERYSEKITLSETIQELESRQTIVQKYLKDARARLLSLQSRYKELIVRGDRDPTVNNSGGRGSRTSSSSAYESSSRTSTSSSSQTDYSSRTSSSSSSASADPQETTNARPGAGSGEKDAWKTEGFGSYGRGRSSRGRQRSARRSRPSSSSSSSSSQSSTTADSGYSRASGSSPSPSPTPDSSSRSSYASSSTSSSSPRPPSAAPVQKSYDPSVPPHRRTSGSDDTAGWKQEDKRRMRELQVDDAFEQLKKDMGM